MFNPAVMVVVLSIPAAAIRRQVSLAEEGIASQPEAYNETSGNPIACTSYCVKCLKGPYKGQTIWYGRNKNWMKIGHAAGGALIGASVAALMTSVVGIPIGLGVGAAAVGATVRAVARNRGDMAQETHTHWSAHIPTTGMFCERTDIIKFAKGLPALLPAGLQAKFGKDLPAGLDYTWLMRSRQTDAEHPENDTPSSNALKPYDTDRNKEKSGFEKEDLDNYKEGCKVVKGAGTRGFQQLTPGKTDEGVQKCSLHSKLCGTTGAPQIMAATTSFDACAALAKNVEE